MKKSGSSWHSPLPRYWPWIGAGLVLIVIMVSLLNVKNSVVWARNLREVIEKAANQGDYELAERLYQTNGDQVLGAQSELEDKIYPERVVARRIADLETKLVEYPGSREIYLALAKLYTQLDNQVKASEYREKARVLDPNN